MNIQGYTNQQAVEVLRHTGQTVPLRLVPRGFRPEETGPPTAADEVTVEHPPTSTPITSPTPTTTLELEEEPEATVEEVELGGREERGFAHMGETSCSVVLLGLFLL